MAVHSGSVRPRTLRTAARAVRRADAPGTAPCPTSASATTRCSPRSAVMEGDLAGAPPGTR
eukprot:6332334-Alexandrium_andersonii.AAC.1